MRRTLAPGSLKSGPGRCEVAADGSDVSRDAPPDVVVDVRGQPCPMPVIELARAVADAEVGAIVEVLSDDPTSKVDVPVWCRMQRHRLVAQHEVEDGGVGFRVEKRTP